MRYAPAGKNRARPSAGSGVLGVLDGERVVRLTGPSEVLYRQGAGWRGGDPDVRGQCRPRANCARSDHSAGATSDGAQHVSTTVFHGPTSTFERNRGLATGWR